MSKILPIVIVLTIASVVVWAQTPPPGGGGSVGAPLDGFTGLLLAAGIGYSAKKIRKNKKEIKP